MDHIARRIVLLARQEASTVDPATVYQLRVVISGTYDGGQLHSTFTYRIGRTRAGQVVMQLQKRNFTGWPEELSVDNAPVLAVPANAAPMLVMPGPAQAGMGALRSVAVDIATFCCPTEHMGLNENEDLTDPTCQCFLTPRHGGADMVAEAKMAADPADTDTPEEVNERRSRLIGTIKALLEDMVGAYHCVQHNNFF